MTYTTPILANIGLLYRALRSGVAFVTILCITSSVLSGPVNPVVVSGSASLPSSKVLAVTNGNGVITNWNQFSIAPGDAVRFVQPGAAQATLNRLLVNPSSISDALTSTGGIQLPRPAGGTNQSGTEIPVGGNVFLTSNNVTGKDIITVKGQTVLATGATVSLADSGMPGIKVEITGAKGNGTNLDAVMATVGRIGIVGALIQNSSQSNTGRVVNEGGRIFFKGGQR